MPTPVQNLLNTSIGIQSLLQMPDATGLPNPIDTPASVLNQSGLEKLFGRRNARSSAEALLCPDIGDGRVVSPEVFESHLTAIVAKLQASDNPKIKALLENEILPLMQNGMLLSAYRGLMLGG